MSNFEHKAKYWMPDQMYFAVIWFSNILRTFVVDRVTRTWTNRIEPAWTWIVYSSAVQGLKVLLIMPFESKFITLYGKPCDIKDLKILRANSVTPESTRIVVKLHLKQIKCKKLLGLPGRNSSEPYFYPGAVLVTISIK